MTCSVGHRHSLGPTLLWLWLWLAGAAPIGPLTWELTYAEGAALKRKKKKKVMSGQENRIDAFLNIQMVNRNMKGYSNQRNANQHDNKKSRHFRMTSIKKMGDSKCW